MARHTPTHDACVLRGQKILHRYAMSPYFGFVKKDVCLRVLLLSDLCRVHLSFARTSGSTVWITTWVMYVWCMCVCMYVSDVYTSMRRTRHGGRVTEWQSDPMTRWAMMCLGSFVKLCNASRPISDRRTYIQTTYTQQTKKKTKEEGKKERREDRLMTDRFLLFHFQIDQSINNHDHLFDC